MSNFRYLVHTDYDPLSVLIPEAKNKSEINSAADAQIIKTLSGTKKMLHFDHIDEHPASTFSDTIQPINDLDSYLNDVRR